MYFPEFEKGEPRWLQIGVAVTQKVSLWISKIIMPIFWARLDVDFEASFTKSGPVLVVVNHKSYYDPLVVANALSYNPSLFPVRYFAKDQLFYNQFGSWFYRFMGCVPVFYKQGLERSLAVPKALLNAGQTLIIFPEGRCVRDETLGEFRAGAAALALQVPNLTVLPMAISHTYRIKWRFLRVPKVRVRVGKPFTLKDKDLAVGENLDPVIDLLRAEVEQLFIKLLEN